ncbi:MAG: heme exporter protein CcmB [Pseudomonadota bacterium]
MSAALATLTREWRLKARGGGWAAAVGLFAVAGGLSPLALGSDPELLSAAAPAVLWLSAILSLLIGLDGLYEEDFRAGGLAVYRLSPLPFPLVILIKTAAAWAATCLPLVLISPVLLYALGAEAPVTGMIGFLLGTPGLALIASALGALCAGLRRGTALIVFLAIPLMTPALVFGPASAGGEPLVPLLVLGTFSLQALALCPFIASAALKAQMS